VQHALLPHLRSIHCCNTCVVPTPAAPLLSHLCHHCDLAPSQMVASNAPLRLQGLERATPVETLACLQAKAHEVARGSHHVRMSPAAVAQGATVVASRGALRGSTHACKCGPMLLLHRSARPPGSQVALAALLHQLVARKLHLLQQLVSRKLRLLHCCTSWCLASCACCIAAPAGVCMAFAACCHVQFGPG
jgi:hypothetical protein